MNLFSLPALLDAVIDKSHEPRCNYDTVVMLVDETNVEVVYCFRKKDLLGDIRSGFEDSLVVYPHVARWDPTSSSFIILNLSW